MRIAAVQLDIAWLDPSANHARVGDLLAASPPQADSLIVLPEMFNTGYAMDASVAQETDGPTPAFCADLARRHASHVLAGYTTRDEQGVARNVAAAFDPAGSVVCTYHKRHPFSPMGEADQFPAGDKVVTFDWAGLTVCPLICYDLRFAEDFLLGLKQGAEAFVVIANFPGSRMDHWHTLLRARAIEYQAYVVGVNRVGRDPSIEYSGGSTVIAPDGEIIADAGDGERVLQADIDPARVADSRSRFPAWREHA